MKAAQHSIAAPWRFAARLYLAVRFWLALNYSWRLSWAKAERV
ncbi:MAG: hypothetical protein ACM3VY_00535 [Candidatus Bathyarchaeota archaeon]